MQGAEAKGKAMHALGWSKNLTEYPTKSLSGILRDVQEDRDVWAKHHIFTKKERGTLMRSSFLWAKMDSNHRSRKTADLQSAPFGHSGICPNTSPLKGDAKVQLFFKFTSGIFVIFRTSQLNIPFL